MKKGETYLDISDIDIPLRYLGERRSLTVVGETYYQYKYQEVKTEKNKNWCREEIRWIGRDLSKCNINITQKKQIMGAGCYYRNKETGTKAFWIDLYDDDENGHERELTFHDTIQDIGNILEGQSTFEQIEDDHYISSLYELRLESTYYGHGLVFRMEPHEDYYNLAMANHAKNYKFIAKLIHAAGYRLRIATSGWTSGEYKPT